MKFVLFLLSAVFLGSTWGSQLDELKKKLALECMKEHPVEMEDIILIFNHVKVPEKTHVKCFLSCVLKKLNVLRQGKIDWQLCRELTRLGLQNDEDKGKADDVADICEKEVEPDQNECELAFKAVVCKIKYSNQFNIPHSVWEN